jgi:PTH1 family peptidyl-tRNA hydrolase
MGRKWGIPLKDRRRVAVLGQGMVGGRPVVLAKPRTFMNASGEGVRYLLARFTSVPEDLIVVYDDMDLPVGKIRVRPGGSAAGHNGIKSIIAALNTQEFPRVRVGIGKAPEGVGGLSYVLGSLDASERREMERAVITAADAVACMLEEGIEAAMNRFN